MQTQAALVEYLYSRVNWSDWTRKWYLSRLTRFVTWAGEQGVADTSGLTAALAHRFYGVLREQGLASASVQGYGARYPHLVRLAGAGRPARREGAQAARSPARR